MSARTSREHRAGRAILDCIAKNTAASTSFTTIDNTVFYGYGDIALLSNLLDDMVKHGLLTEPRFSYYSITDYGRRYFERGADAEMVTR